MPIRTHLTHHARRRLHRRLRARSAEPPAEQRELAQAASRRARSTPAGACSRNAAPACYGEAATGTARRPTCWNACRRSARAAPSAARCTATTGASRRRRRQDSAAAQRARALVEEILQRRQGRDPDAPTWQGRVRRNYRRPHAYYRRAGRVTSLGCRGLSARGAVACMLGGGWARCATLRSSPRPGRVGAAGEVAAHGADGPDRPQGMPHQPSSSDSAPGRRRC